MKKEDKAGLIIAAFAYVGILLTMASIKGCF